MCYVAVLENSSPYISILKITGKLGIQRTPKNIACSSISTLLVNIYYLKTLNPLRKSLNVFVCQACLRFVIKTWKCFCSRTGAINKRFSHMWHTIYYCNIDEALLVFKLGIIWNFLLYKSLWQQLCIICKSKASPLGNTIKCVLTI